MPNKTVFQICIPLTDGDTGFTHPPEALDDWLDLTAKAFGGATIIGIALLGLWYDEERSASDNPVEDYSNWYKVAVLAEDADRLRRHVREAARLFGQRCIYLEQAGEAELIWKG